MIAFEVGVERHIRIVATAKGDLVTRCMGCGESIMQRHGRAGPMDREMYRVARERIIAFDREHESCGTGGER